MQTDWHLGYVAFWLFLCVVALGLALWKGKGWVIASRAYWRLLLRPWKLAAFVVAFVGIVWMAPYTGDPTWDHYDAAFMALFAYVTAPWAAGALYRASKASSFGAESFAALVVWLFSASWSYDGYLFLRDGVYPPSWGSNLAASSCLYAMAGLMWSLEDSPGLGLVVSWMQDDWCEGDYLPFSLKLLAAGALAAAPVLAVFLYLLYDGLSFG